MAEHGKPPAYEYSVLKYGSHDELEEALNDLVLFCWEPVSYAIWSLANTAYHFVILRRDPFLFEHVADFWEDRLRTETDREKRKRFENLLKRAGRRK